MDIFIEIEKVDESIINDVLHAVLERYNELFPDWEIRTVAIRTDEDREQQYEDILRMLKTAGEIAEGAGKLPACNRSGERHTQLRVVGK